MNVSNTTGLISPKQNNNVIKQAHFTKRIVDDDSTILIGDKNMYIPTCRTCYLEKQI